MSWHSPSCTQLDVLWEDARPGCKRCGTRLPRFSEGGVKPIPPPPPPPDTPLSQLRVSWPPSVEYESSPRNDGILAIIRDNIDGWDLSKTPDTVELSTSPTSEPSHSEDLPTTEDQLSKFGSALLLPTIYQHLPRPDSIRLLVLQGSSDNNAPLCCSLEIAHLQDLETPIFEAISYTWADEDGNADLCEPIYLGPELQVLLVTKNCSRALRRFRKSINRLLWIDAICINQADVVERENQVRLMGSVYAQASRVIVYLGKGNSNIMAAMRSLTNQSPKDGPTAGGFEQGLGYSHFEVPQESVSIGFLELSQAKYFKRAWVIQEVALSTNTTLTCGSETVTWTSLQQQAQVSEWARIIGGSLETDLFDLLKMSRHCSCGDPRDKVYSLFGLLNDAESKELPVDYGLSVQNVYTGITSYLLAKVSSALLEACLRPVVEDEMYVRRMQNRPIGYRCGKTPIDLVRQDKRTPNLPSWVPDWDYQPQSETSVLYLTLYGPIIVIPVLTYREAPTLQSYQQPVIYSNEEFSCNGISSASGDPEVTYAHKENFLREVAQHQQESSSAMEDLKVTVTASPATLVVRAYRLFTVTRHQVLMTCIPHNPLKLPLDRSRPWFRLDEETDWGGYQQMDHKTICFLVPALDRVVFLRQQDDHVYSMLCSRQVAVATTVKHNHDFLIIGNWTLTNFFLRFRSDAASSQDGGDEGAARFCNDWFEEFDHYMRQSGRSIRNSYTWQLRLPGESSTFHNMLRLRQEILAMLVKHVVTDLGRFKSTTRENTVLDFSGMTSTDFVPTQYTGRGYTGHGSSRFLYSQIAYLDSTWIHHDVGEDQVMEMWKSAVNDFEIFCERFGTLEESLQELDTSRYYPKFGLSLEPQVADVRERFTARFVEVARQLGAQPPGGPYTAIHISIADVVTAAYKMLNDLELDPMKPWFWNLDRFWIHIATLQMISELQVSLFHRRMLRRLQEGLSYPEDIIIV